MSKTRSKRVAKIQEISAPAATKRRGAPGYEPAVFQPEVTLAPFPGYVDFFGYCNAAGGWLFSGWVPRPPNTDQPEPVEFLAQFELSQTKGRATVAFYQRADLDQKSIGVIAFVPGSSRVAGALQHVMFMLNAVKFQVQAGHGTQRLDDMEVVDRVRSNLIHQAFANRNREYLLSITARRGFTGQDTLSTLGEPILLEIDEAILCPPDGVLVKGWLIAAPGTIRSLRMRSGPMSGELALADSIAVSRPDVIDAVGRSVGFTDTRCGFISYVPAAISPGDATYIEVELESGEIGFKKLTLSKGSGLDAIRRILDGIQVRYGEMDPAFDKVLGPAVSSLNVARLRTPVSAVPIEFGVAPKTPRFSLIIPLYGRVDFIEYQIALFSRHRGMRETEILYVLDDPSKRRELESLAESTFERFGIPFTVLLLPVNIGFGPANNVGLRAARGDYICFLNSDIFPITEDWMERLVKRLKENSDLGTVGARLLFEDGSIQHEGCFYRTIAEFGNWTFVDHFNKGRRPEPDQGLRLCDVITGACMVMSRALAQQLGGFDESYIIGDFEDSDLCRKVAALGLTSAVDNDVLLYHLERKSQIGPSQNWRMNLTLYNAWVHQRRWFHEPAPAPAMMKK